MYIRDELLIPFCLQQLEAHETAKVFEQFVASFEEPSKTSKAFVRGSTINPDKKGEVVSGW